MVDETELKPRRWDTQPDRSRGPFRGSARNSDDKPSRLNHALNRAEMLFGYYRRTDANDPDRYAAGIAAVLMQFPQALVDRVTDPNTGIHTTEKFRGFLPNVGELKAYCDQIAAVEARMGEYAKQPKVRFPPPLPLPNVPGRRANITVYEGAPMYNRMAERAKTADPLDWKWVEGGIKVPLGWFEGAARPVKKRGIRSLGEIAAECGLTAEQVEAIPNATFRQG
jgi:hypothetical protein